MIEVADEVIGRSEPICFSADHLGFVVESFDRAVIDGHMKPTQDVLFMAADHPGELANGFKPGMRSPPEPLFKILPGPGVCFVAPEIAKAFLEEIGPVDFQVHLLKMAELGSLFRR